MAVAAAVAGVVLRAFCSRVLIVSSGYSEQSTVRPATAPDWDQFSFRIMYRAIGDVQARTWSTERPMALSRGVAGSWWGRVFYRDNIASLCSVYSVGN